MLVNGFEKTLTNVMVKKVGNVTMACTTHVDVVVHKTDGDEKTLRRFGTNLYYVSFRVADEYGEYECVCIIDRLGSATEICAFLNEYKDNAVMISCIKGYSDNGILDVSSIMPRVYNF